MTFEEFEVIVEVLVVLLETAFTFGLALVAVAEFGPNDGANSGCCVKDAGGICNDDGGDDDA